MCRVRPLWQLCCSAPCAVCWMRLCRWAQLAVHEQDRAMLVFGALPACRPAQPGGVQGRACALDVCRACCHRFAAPRVCAPGGPCADLLQPVSVTAACSVVHTPTMCHTAIATVLQAVQGQHRTEQGTLQTTVSRQAAWLAQPAGPTQQSLCWQELQEHAHAGLTLAWLARVGPAAGTDPAPEGALALLHRLTSRAATVRLLSVVSLSDAHLARLLPHIWRV